MESQSAVEDSRNKENVNGSGGFIVLQTQLHWQEQCVEWEATSVTAA